MEFKAYLSQKYQGYDSFIKNIIYPIFGEDRYETAYNIEMLEPDSELVNLADRTGISSVIYCGTIELEDNPVYLFDITVKDKVMMERNRVAVQTLVKRVMDTYSGAFMLIHYENSEKWDWRFTFCQLKDRGEYTDSKRYTFLLGPNQACTTAAQNFGKLAAKGGDIEIGDIVKAFDVEALSNEFFGKYKAHYEAFVEYITGKRYEGKEEKTVHDPHPFFASLFGGSDKAVRDYVKLLLGRITFLHFLQKKGWLGVPENGVWGSGDELFMLNQFEKAGQELKDDFVVKVLNPLFFDALDCDRTGTNDVFDSRVFGRIRVPYLNGGMFEKTEKDAVPVSWPAAYFGRLFRFFSEYNFTIDENDPTEAQVGVDPEMLGKIFENLLEDNKDKGAFYTPKTIVKYMCQESLIAYLVAKTGFDEKKLRDFVHSPEEGKAAFDGDQQYAILDAILKVKICDPAIGSGAFPIGLLNELVWCKEAIYGDQKGRAEIKREIIRDNIYGVDIEKGAVDIARLRFWLSLVVDEEEPSPLPNLDYKIMQGNSLLEWYNGIELTELVSQNGQDLMFNNEHADKLKQKLSKLLKDYFGESDHIRKAALKVEISSIIRELLGNAGIIIPKDMDVAENNLFFLWHTWFSDVFAQGGFDICIGNPPYINLSKVSQYKNVLKTLYKSIHTGYNDLMYYFISLGTQILNPEGISVLITSNYFIGNDYAEKLRLFLNSKLERIINFKEKRIFETASIHTCISFTRKRSINPVVLFYDYTGDDYPDSVNLDNEFKKVVVNRNSLSEKWIVASGKDSQLVELLSVTKNKLGDIALIEQGSKSGCNSVFTIPYSFAVSRSFESGVLRLNVKNSDIGRYYYSNRGNVLIYTDNDTEIQKFPNVLHYLNENKETLARRNEVSHGLYPWYRFDRPRNREIFDSKEKIIVPYRAEHNRFAYDDKQAFNDGGDIRAIVINPESGYSIKFILGILNSRLIDWYFGFIGKTKGRIREYFNAPLSSIPIPSATKEQQVPIIALVDKILAAKKADHHADTSAWEAEIDRLVYDLYGVPQEDRQ